MIYQLVILVVQTADLVVVFGWLGLGASSDSSDWGLLIRGNRSGGRFHQRCLTSADSASIDLGAPWEIRCNSSLSYNQFSCEFL